MRMRRHQLSAARHHQINNGMPAHHRGGIAAASSWHQHNIKRIIGEENSKWRGAISSAKKINRRINRNAQHGGMWRKRLLAAASAWHVARVS